MIEKLYIIEDIYKKTSTKSCFDHTSSEPKCAVAKERLTFKCKNRCKPFFTYKQSIGLRC